MADATGWGVEISVWALAIVCLAASRRLQQTCLFINVDLCLLKGRVGQDGIEELGMGVHISSSGLGNT